MTNLIKQTIADNKTTRWTVLVLVSLAMMCGYFLTDAIGPLKSILEGTLGWTSTDFGIFNSGYGWLNVFLFMMIVGGVILDKKGARFTGMMSLGVMVVGASIKYYALEFMGGGDATIWGMKQDVVTAAAGYAIFAFGYETINITCTKLIVKWFSGKELALALGLNVAFARLGTMLAMGMPLRIAEWTESISAPVLFGTVLLLLGFLTYIFVMVMDLRLDKQTAAQSTTTEDDEKFRLTDIVSIIKMRGFWYISILCLVFYIAVMTFQKFGVQFIGSKFSMSETSAGDIMSILPIGALFLTPLFGGFYDRRGHGVGMMTLGCLLIITVYAIFATPAITNMYVMIATILLLGISFSLVPSAMWPSVAKIIPQQKLGTAYALIFWVQGIGLSNAPLLIGYILDKYSAVTVYADGKVAYDYTLPMLAFMAFGVIALMFSMALKREDTKKGYNLEKPNIEK